LGIAIAVLIALLLILLAIALFCRMEYKVKLAKPDAEADFEYDIRIKWLFGIIKRKIKSGEEAPAAAVSGPSADALQKEGAEKKDEDAGAEKDEKKKTAKKRRLDVLKGLDFDSGIRIAGYTLALLKKLFAAFRPKRIVIRGRYGAQNPAVTGKVLAAVYAAAAMLDIEADVRGNFEQEELQVDVRVLGYFRLWAIFVPMVRYILRPEIWRLIFPKRSKEEKRAKKEAKKMSRKNDLEVDEDGNRI
jgi:hypothetical protein